MQTRTDRNARVAIESAIREWFRAQPGHPVVGENEQCLCERCTKWTEDLAEVVMQALVRKGGGR